MSTQRGKTTPASTNGSWAPQTGRTSRVELEGGGTLDDRFDALEATIARMRGDVVKAQADLHVTHQRRIMQIAQLEFPQARSVSIFPNNSWGRPQVWVDDAFTGEMQIFRDAGESPMADAIVDAYTAMKADGWVDNRDDRTAIFADSLDRKIRAMNRTDGDSRYHKNPDGMTAGRQIADNMLAAYGSDDPAKVAIAAGFANDPEQIAVLDNTAALRHTTGSWGSAITAAGYELETVAAADLTRGDVVVTAADALIMFQSGEYRTPLLNAPMHDAVVLSNPSSAYPTTLGFRPNETLTRIRRTDRN